MDDLLGVIGCAVFAALAVRLNAGKCPDPNLSTDERFLRFITELLECSFAYLTQLDLPI